MADLDPIDLGHARALINERRELLRRLAGLSNAPIALKLDLSRAEVAALAREMPPLKTAEGMF